MPTRPVRCTHSWRVNLSPQYVEIELRGAKYKFAPLTIAQLEKHEAAITSFLADSSYKNFGLLAAPMADSLSLHHPGMTEAMVRELIDLGSFRNALEAMMGVSGLTRATTGEATPQSVN